MAASPAAGRRDATCGAWSWPAGRSRRGGGGCGPRRRAGCGTSWSASGGPSYATRPSRITTARSTSGASGPSSWATSTMVAPRALSWRSALGERLLVGQVDAGGRLVEEEQVGLPGQRPGDQHPLLLAAGELGDPVARRGRRARRPPARRRSPPGRRARAAAAAGGGSAGPRRPPPTPRPGPRMRRRPAGARTRCAASRGSRPAGCRTARARR